MNEQPPNSNQPNDLSNQAKPKRNKIVMAIAGVIGLCCCGAIIVGSLMPSPESEPTIIAQENLPEATASGELSEEETIVTAESEQPVNVPSATDVPTNTPAPVGLSRSNPFPTTDIASAPNWDVEVLEIKRGEEAWRDIQVANSFNEPAPDGMEYLLVKILVKSTYADSETHSISGCDFDVTGDTLINYTCSMASVVEPDPQLDASLFSGGEAEGWAAYLISLNETNLILVVDELFNFDSDAKRYIALEEGASINISSDLENIQPTDLGKERNEPAPRTETVVTEDWELLITDVIRGNEAWTMVQEANQFNEPPLEGFEYIAIKVRTRYIGTEDKAVNIDGTFFKSTGSAGVLYDAPTIVDPLPQLDISLYPGGEFEGWIVVQASVDETNMMLVFEPLFDFGGRNKRFILIEP